MRPVVPLLRPARRPGCTQKSWQPPLLLLRRRPARLPVGRRLGRYRGRISPPTPHTHTPSARKPVSRPTARPGEAVPFTRMSDPNFPDHLAIKPSNPGTRAGEGAAASWDQDSAADIASYGIAGRIWEASHALRRYLEPRPPASCDCLQFDPPAELASHASPPPIAVELGAGVGYVGINFALALDHEQRSRIAAPASAAPAAVTPLRAPTIILTDLDNVCPLLERNLHLAFPEPATHVDARVMPLSWGSEADARAVLAACPAPPTHILCSDLVYFPELLPLLLRSLIQLTADPEHSPRVIIAYRVRSLAKEQPFWLALGAWFDLVPVQARRQPPPACPTPAVAGARTSVSASADAATATAKANTLASVWHRFGAWASDVLPEAKDEPPEDEYFVFSCTRRADSFAVSPPQDDTRLMGGWRDGSDAGQHSAAGDTFELLLLGDLADL